jgi:hypothetical protein
VFPLDAGIAHAPSVSQPAWPPRPPVNRPYPHATWNMSPGTIPPAAKLRAMTSPKMRKSSFVYAPIVGLPVVPDDA